MTRRAAKYKRISRDREGRELGVERQDDHLNVLADQRDLTVVADYCDNDLSASTRSSKARPDYQQMLADARAGHFDVIIAYTTGRITRRPREFEDLIELAEKHGIQFVYVRSPEFDLTTAQGRRIARTLAAQDAGEAEDISERVTDQKAQAASKGEWLGGRRPYGFEADGVTVREAEADVIREGIDAVLAGDSLRGLARSWNARGLITSTGKAWRQDTVRKVLMRPRNAGLMEHQKQIIGKASWPAIVEEETWRTAQAILADPERRTQWSSARRWLVSGLAICDVCDAPVKSGRLHAAGGNIPQYQCGNGKHVARNAVELDQYVCAVVAELLARKDAADLLAQPQDENRGGQRADLLALRKRRRSLASLIADGTLSEVEVRAEARKLDARIGELEVARTKGRRGDVLAVILNAPDPVAAWEAIEDLGRRRAVVDALMDIRILQTAKGRRKGWKPGESYFDPASVRITPKGVAGGS